MTTGAAVSVSDSHVSNGEAPSATGSMTSASSTPSTCTASARTSLVQSPTRPAESNKRPLSAQSRGSDGQGKKTSMQGKRRKSNNNQSAGLKRFRVPDIDDLPQAINSVPPLPKAKDSQDSTKEDSGALNPVQEYERSLSRDTITKLLSFFDPSQNQIVRGEAQPGQEQAKSSATKHPDKIMMRRSPKDVAAERRIRQKERAKSKEILSFHKAEKKTPDSTSRENTPTQNEATDSHTAVSAAQTPAVKNRWMSSGAEQLASISSGVNAKEDSRRSQNLQSQLYKSLNNPSKQSSKEIKSQLYRARQKHEQATSPGKNKSQENTSNGTPSSSGNSHTQEVVIGTNTTVNIAATSDICRYHLLGNCLKGDQCLFNHDLSSHPCRFFHAAAIGNSDPDASGGGTCKQGDNCTFSHGTLDHQQRAVLELEISRLKAGAERINHQSQEDSRSSEAPDTTEDIEQSAPFS
eukprot:gb/GECG01016806.1/.p1 GENE.gb/GECG01016806.1/~~gb/GECG01016806.1/.p1  ORF type:complete len:464 (+),score=66.17 gb/GECG01016806.1/:1-1392(+)